MSLVFVGFLLAVFTSSIVGFFFGQYAATWSRQTKLLRELVAACTYIVSTGVVEVPTRAKSSGLPDDIAKLVKRFICDVATQCEQEAQKAAHESMKAWLKERGFLVER